MNEVTAPGAGQRQQESRSSLSLPADMLELRRLTGWLTELLAVTGLEAAALMGRVELAVHEVCMNIVDHAYGPQHVSTSDDLTIEGVVDPSAVRIRVRDSGDGIDFDSVVEPVAGAPQIRGYGLMIVRKLVDELGYVRTDDTNIWTLRIDRRPGTALEGQETPT